MMLYMNIFVLFVLIYNFVMFLLKVGIPIHEKETHIGWNIALALLAVVYLAKFN